MPIAAPVNLTPPVITGNFAPGGTISASEGTWSGEPTSFSYLWRRAWFWRKPDSLMKPGESEWFKVPHTAVSDSASIRLVTPFQVSNRFYGHPFECLEGLCIGSFRSEGFDYGGSGGFYYVGLVCEVTATNGAGSTTTSTAMVREQGAPAGYSGPPGNEGKLVVLRAGVAAATEVWVTLNDFIDPFVIPLASAFSVTGKTVERVYFVDYWKAVLVVSPVITGDEFTNDNDDTAHQGFLSYTVPSTNPLHSLGQLQLASFSGKRIGR